MVSNVARRDEANDLEVNGERIVQRSALTHSPCVVLDVGAHFGEWSESLLSLGDVSQLTCFEPSRDSAVVLRETMAGRENVTVEQFAVSDQEGQAMLKIVHPGAGSNSLISFSDPHRATDVESVRLVSIDRYCARRGIQGVTLLKIDAEGHDLAVMRGAVGMLTENRVGMVQFEYNWRWVEARYFLRDAFQFLEPLGYRIGKVTGDGIEFYPAWHFELETFRENNYLAVLPKLAGPLPKLRWWMEGWGNMDSLRGSDPIKDAQ